MPLVPSEVQPTNPTRASIETKPIANKLVVLTSASFCYVFLTKPHSPDLKMCTNIIDSR